MRLRPAFFIQSSPLLEALRRLAGDRDVSKGPPVWFVFSVEEEIGLVGAEAIAKRTAPPRVFAVDSLVTSDSPLEPKRIANLRLGEGATVRAIDQSGVSSREEVEAACATPLTKDFSKFRRSR